MTDACPACGRSIGGAHDWPQAVACLSALAAKPVPVEAELDVLVDQDVPREWDVIWETTAIVESDPRAAAEQALNMIEDLGCQLFQVTDSATRKVYKVDLAEETVDEVVPAH